MLNNWSLCIDKHQWVTRHGAEKRTSESRRKKNVGCPRWGSNSRHPHSSDTVYKYGALVQLSYGGYQKDERNSVLINDWVLPASIKLHWKQQKINVPTVVRLRTIDYSYGFEKKLLRRSRAKFTIVVLWNRIFEILVKTNRQGLHQFSLQWDSSEEETSPLAGAFENLVRQRKLVLEFLRVNEI